MMARRCSCRAMDGGGEAASLGMENGPACLNTRAWTTEKALTSVDAARNEDVQDMAEKKKNRERLRLLHHAEKNKIDQRKEQGTNQLGCSADHVKEEELVFMNHQWRKPEVGEADGNERRTAALLQRPVGDGRATWLVGGNTRCRPWRGGGKRKLERCAGRAMLDNVIWSSAWRRGWPWS